MIPIQDLLNRIIWDKDFGRGNFDEFVKTEN